MKGILVYDNGDFVVKDGHIAIGDNRAQCAQHLIGAFTGEYKHAPLLGGNARNMIASCGSASSRRNVWHWWTETLRWS